MILLLLILSVLLNLYYWSVIRKLAKIVTSLQSLNCISQGTISKLKKENQAKDDEVHFLKHRKSVGKNIIQPGN
jgi:hypothetical protein